MGIARSKTMKIFGIIAVLSTFLTVDANRQCRKEMTSLFGKTDRKDFHKKFRAICAQNKGFLDGSCEDKPERWQSRCSEAKELLAEVLPKFEKLDDSKCLKIAANVCKRPEPSENKEDQKKEETEKEEEEKEEKKKQNKRPKGNKKGLTKKRFEQLYAKATAMCEKNKNRCKLLKKLNKIKEKFQNEEE